MTLTWTLRPFGYAQGKQAQREVRRAPFPASVGWPIRLLQSGLNLLQPELNLLQPELVEGSICSAYSSGSHCILQDFLAICPFQPVQTKWEAGHYFGRKGLGRNNRLDNNTLQAVRSVQFYVGSVARTLQ